jgi:branched-chain amino acid transport system permease protein
VTAIAEAATRPILRGRLSGSALVVAGAAALLLGALLPWLVPSKITLSLIAQASFDMLLATSVGFLLLQNGRVSFGQAAFSGLGAYAFGALVAHQLVDPE